MFFFIPIGDDNPHTQTPYVTRTLVVLCVAVFLLELAMGAGMDRFLYRYGFVPATLLRDVPAAGPPLLTLFTSMFLHAGWLHLGGNMVYLWIFGDNVEASLGHWRYLLLYLSAGVAGAMLQSFSSGDSGIPLIGASGAIAGALGAYLLLHPRGNIQMLYWIVFFVGVAVVPAFWVLGVWIIGQFFSLGFNTGSNVAYLAHIGGFLCGMALTPILRRRGVRLFESPRSRPYTFRRWEGGALPRLSDDDLQDLFRDAQRRSANRRRDDDH